MKTKSAKAKGRKLQQWVRDVMLGLASKELEPDDITSRSMGAGGEDLLLSPSARKLFPVSIECKSYARHLVYTLYQQAVDNCPDGAEPVLVIKQNRSDPMVVVDAEYFFRKVKDAG